MMRLGVGHQNVCVGSDLDPHQGPTHLLMTNIKLSNGAQVTFALESWGSQSRFGPADSRHECW